MKKKEMPNVDRVFSNVWHVVPVNDSGDHIEKCDFHSGTIHCFCSCCPVHLPQDNGSMVIVHNSFDGREGVEWTEDILNNSTPFE